METIRKGHDSELLRYLEEEFPLEQGFTIVFHGRRPNLDLVANSVEEAQIWMRGLQLLVDLVTSMDHQEQLDQYQPDGGRVWAAVTEGVRRYRTREYGKGVEIDPGGVRRDRGQQANEEMDVCQSESETETQLSGQEGGPVRAGMALFL